MEAALGHWVGGLLVFALGCASAGTDSHPTEPAAPPLERQSADAVEAAEPAPPGMVGVASYYSDRLAGRRTASGERYDPRALTAAHRKLPFGTVVEVKRSDGRAVVVRINDRGPYAGGRVIDLSRRAAEAIGMMREGVVEVELRIVAAAPPRRRVSGR